MPPLKHALLFAAMCLIWGLTWIAAKEGVAVIPPFLFAGTRFIAAGVLMMGAIAASGGPLLPARTDWGRFLLTALIINVATYAPLFWAMQYVVSGVAAVINMSLMPVALFVIGILYGEERFTYRQLAATMLGVIGLVILLGPKAVPDGESGGGLGIWGEAAIIAATIAYAWGSVMSRPLLRRYSPLLLSAVTTLIGGVILFALSLAVEQVDLIDLAGRLTVEAVGGWFFMMAFGSLAAFTIFLRLVRDWSAAKAGMYAFVSPAIAVIAGALYFGERFGASDLTGMALMLTATGLALTQTQTQTAAVKDRA